MFCVSSLVFLLTHFDPMFFRSLNRRCELTIQQPMEAFLNTRAYINLPWFPIGRFPIFHRGWISTSLPTLSPFILTGYIMHLIMSLEQSPKSSHSCTQWIWNSMFCHHQARQLREYAVRLILNFELSHLLVFTNAFSTYYRPAAVPLGFQSWSSGIDQYVLMRC